VVRISAKRFMVLVLTGPKLSSFGRYWNVKASSMPNTKSSENASKTARVGPIGRKGPTRVSIRRRAVTNLIALFVLKLG